MLEAGNNHAEESIQHLMLNVAQGSGRIRASPATAEIKGNLKRTWEGESQEDVPEVPKSKVTRKASTTTPSTRPILTSKPTCTTKQTFTTKPTIATKAAATKSTRAKTTSIKPITKGTTTAVNAVTGDALQILGTSGTRTRFMSKISTIAAASTTATSTAASTAAEPSIAAEPSTAAAETSATSTAASTAAEPPTAAAETSAIAESSRSASAPNATLKSKGKRKAEDPPSSDAPISAGENDIGEFEDMIRSLDRHRFWKLKSGRSVEDVLIEAGREWKGKQ
ncbi:MAG: hypothetical protein J3Q66DRAFT_88716 [Benniella sp.]|nr:MAG: hypothetical protein J3Q66DRAFT_88716 [Benniella sp.]